jgi:hypothetical protein
LIFSKKRRKSKKEIRRGIKAQLQYVRRDLKAIDQMLERPGRKHVLTESDKDMLDVIRKVYEQQKWMYDNKKHSIEDRIVSLYQWWVRPIVRGKDKNKTEFGAKINVSEVNGFCRIDHFNWDAFNEGTLLKEQVENFKDVYGRYPKYLLADRIYLTRENRKFLKEKGIEAPGEYVVKVIRLIKDRATFVSDFWEHSDFFFIAPVEYDAKMVKKRWKENTGDILANLMKALEKTDTFSAATLEPAIREYLEKNELGMGQVMTALRLALVGSGRGPGVFEIMEMLGRQEVANRVERAINQINK